MKQNIFWLMIFSVIIFGLGGFLTITAQNKLPGIIVMLVALVDAIAIYVVTRKK